MSRRYPAAQFRHGRLRCRLFFADNGIIRTISATQDQVFNLFALRLAGRRANTHIDAIQTFRPDVVGRIASGIDIDNKQRLPSTVSRENEGTMAGSQADAIAEASPSSIFRSSSSDTPTTARVLSSIPKTTS